jgi:hypothetical protein
MLESIDIYLSQELSLFAWCDDELYEPIIENLY